MKFIEIQALTVMFYKEVSR